MQRVMDCRAVDRVPSFEGTISCLPAKLWRERWNPLGRQLLVVGAICIGIVSTLHLQLMLDRQASERAVAADNIRYLPTGEFLKAALIGYQQAGADLLWLQIIQHIGAHDADLDNPIWLYHALDVVTTLDPHFIDAYDLGSVMLAELGGRVDWSNALLQKGMAANPSVWRLPFVKGFNDFFHLNEYESAANAIAQSARLPGAPAYLPQLATRLFAQAQRPEAALVLIDRMLDDAGNPKLRQALEERRKEIVIERDIIHLEQAMMRYRERYHRPLLSLADLVERNVLSALPVEPFGGTYDFDRDLGRVVSSTHRQRLRLHRPMNAPMLREVNLQ